MWTKVLTSELEERQGLLMVVTEAAPPPDCVEIPGLPDLAGNFAGRRPKQVARTCLLVHNHYLEAVSVSEAPGAAVGPGEALPDGHC